MYSSYSTCAVKCYMCMGMSIPAIYQESQTIIQPVAHSKVNSWQLATNACVWNCTAYICSGHPTGDSSL